MTGDRDFERVLDRWFGEGSSRMPDGFVTRMVSRIDAVPQSRRARARTWWLAKANVRLAPKPNVRLAAALALVVIVAVVGGTILSRLPAVGVPPSPSTSPSGAPSATSLAPIMPAIGISQLQATWTSVGTRVLPYKDSTYAGATELVIGSGTVTIGSVTDVLSSVAMVGPDRLELTSETGPSTMGFKCKVGDLGVYTYMLSVTGGRLTLTAINDACPGRAAVLTGDWDHTNLGPLAPGRHVGTPFRPFGGGTGGSFSFTVPAGWKEQGESQIFFAVSGPDPAVLTSISVLSNVAPYTGDKTCGRSVTAEVGRTPPEVAAWLTSLKSLVVTKPTQVTVGGLDGVMIDVSVARGWDQPCVTPPLAGTDVYTFADATSGDPGTSIGGDTRERYFLLDRGDGQTLLIDIEVQDSASWDAVITTAMPVVNSFEFSR